MIYLKNERAWTRWARKNDRYQQTKFTPPTEYPCFAYAVVESYGYEEDQAQYLYRKDVERMATRFAAEPEREVS